jgi:hypothetical protein
VFKEREPVKVKGTEDWQEEKHLQDSFMETIRELQQGGIDKQHATINKGLL